MPTGTGPLVSGPRSGRERWPPSSESASCSWTGAGPVASGPLQSMTISGSQRTRFWRKNGLFSAHFTAPWRCAAGIYHAKSTRKPDTPGRAIPPLNSRLRKQNPCTVPEGTGNGAETPYREERATDLRPTVEGRILGMTPHHSTTPQLSHSQDSERKRWVDDGRFPATSRF